MGHKKCYLAGFSDTQRNDPQLDVTQHTSNYQSSAQLNNNQYNEPQYKNTHHNTLLNDNKHNDPQHNVTQTYELQHDCRKA